VSDVKGDSGHLKWRCCVHLVIPHYSANCLSEICDVIFSNFAEFNVLHYPLNGRS